MSSEIYIKKLYFLLKCKMTFCSQCQEFIIVFLGFVPLLLLLCRAAGGLCASG